MKLDERIRRLEKQMDVTDFEPDSTKIAWECLTKRQRLVFQKIQEIQKEYGNEPPGDVLAENMDLFRMGYKIMWMRTMDLFQNVINGMFLKEDKLNT